MIQVSCFTAATHNDTVALCHSEIATCIGRKTNDGKQFIYAMFERELEKQLVLKKIFLLPFGKSAEELRKKETNSADTMTAVRTILLHSRTTSQKLTFPRVSPMMQNSLLHSRCSSWWWSAKRRGVLRKRTSSELASRK